MSSTGPATSPGSTFPLLAACSRTDIRSSQHNGSSLRGRTSATGKCSRAGRKEHGEYLGKRWEKAASGDNLAFVCERSLPAIQAEALCFPIVRNTCVLCSKHSGEGGCDSLIECGFFRKRCCHFLPGLIGSPLFLTIRCSYLCLATLKLSPSLTGRSRPRHGQPCSAGRAGKSLRHYGVLHEAVRRELRAARRC